MNTTFVIEKARVVKIGKFMSGESERFGKWKRIRVKVEWDYQFHDDMGQPKIGHQTAVVTCKGEKAESAAGYFHTGGEGSNEPTTYLNLKVRMEGRLDEIDRRDGNGKWELAENDLTVVWYEFTQP